MDKMVIIGGTGGLGRGLTEVFAEIYEVVSVGSADVDVTSMDSVRAFFNKHEDAAIVINLSGVSHNKFLHKYGDAPGQESMQLQLNVNVSGSTNVLAACLPAMRKNRYGRIIFMSSVLAELPVLGAGIYSASKAYIDALMRTAALENSSMGITCNSVQLGYFDAGLLYSIPEPAREHIRESIPMKRWGRIEELAKLINYLIEVEYVTGTNQKINGCLR